MYFNDFLNGKPFVFEGIIVESKSNKKDIHVQLHPGIIVEINREFIEKIEEAKDEISGLSYVKIELKPDAEVGAVFNPKLARLAKNANNSGVPFEINKNFSQNGIGSKFYIPKGFDLNDGDKNVVSAIDTIGEVKTGTNYLFWGWQVDDHQTYSDERESDTSVPFTGARRPF